MSTGLEPSMAYGTGFYKRRNNDFSVVKYCEILVFETE